MSVAAANTVDLLRLDGRLYRVVGETMVDGERMRVCAPVGRGPLRAIPCQPKYEAETVTEGSSDKSTDRANAASVVSSAAVVAQEGRTLHPSRHQQPSSTWERLHRAALPAPGRVGYLPIAVLLAVLSALAAALD